ncbi:MAG: GIY-YIG nuclease family protein [Candidatus Cloacimonetes bacterium]|nr:GIY-YIG nuclease family protein [Candidatus Cloacimonadota bacterium]
MNTLTPMEKLVIWARCYTSLALATEVAPDTMGCYCFVYEGNIVYIGKAESGIKSRLQQHYNGNGTSDSSKRIYQIRDHITAHWKVLKTKQECQDFEAKYIDSYDPEWNEISGWKSCEASVVPNQQLGLSLKST